MTAALHILGAGGHAKVVIEAAFRSGKTVAGIFDDDIEKQGKLFLGCPVLGKISDFFVHATSESRVHCAIGSNKARERIYLSYKYSGCWETIQHPASVISSSAIIDAGVFIGAFAAVQPDARVGRHSIINTNVVIEHDVEISDCVHIAPGSTLGGNVVVGTGSLVGLGSKLLPGIKVGSWAKVGAGSVVTKDVASRVVVAGVPARWLREDTSTDG